MTRLKYSPQVGSLDFGYVCGALATLRYVWVAVVKKTHKFHRQGRLLATPLGKLPTCHCHLRLFLFELSFSSPLIHLWSLQARVQFPGAADLNDDVDLVNPLLEEPFYVLDISIVVSQVYQCK